jgi:hypothetical protein
VVNNDHHEDIYVALRDAFEAAKRQLEDYAAKRRGDGGVRRVGRNGDGVGEELAE